MRKFNHRPPVWWLVFAGIVGLIGISIVVVSAATSLKTAHSAGCVVNDKDRSYNYSTKKSDMRIYTDNCGVFSVGDSLLSGTWHSADTFSRIKPGHTYNFDTRGARIPLFSQFPNITHVEEVR